MALRRNAATGIYFGDWYFTVDKKQKRIRRTSGTKIKKQAEVWHRKLEEELWHLYRLGEVTHLWDDAVIGYMKNREEKASYGHDIARLKWLDSYLGGKNIKQVNTDLLTEVRDTRLTEVAPGTTNRLMNLVSAILHYAEEREWIVRAPKIPRAEVPEPFPDYLTPDEVSRLIRALSTPRSKHLVAFVTFAIATGLRMRNISYLEWPQIDLQRKELWVNPSDSKNRKPIAIPLVDDAIAVIRDQIGKHQHRVFTYRGKPYDRVGIRALNQAAQKAGIDKHIHPHLFRHTFASWHVMRGTSLYELMQLGGWRKIESVMVYAHLSSKHLTQAAQNRESIEHVFEEALQILGEK